MVKRESTREALVGREREEREQPEHEERDRGADDAAARSRIGVAVLDRFSRLDEGVLLEGAPPNSAASLDGRSGTTRS